MPHALTLNSYIAWHLETLHEDLSSNEFRQRYELNQNALLLTVQQSTVLRHVIDLLDAHPERTTAYNTSDVILVKKPYDSLVDKLFRQNCLWNRHWPNAPSGGWRTHSNCFETIDDILRTTIVCRFLDDPEFFSKQIALIANADGLEASASPRATDDGYYAWHTYVQIPSVVIGVDAVKNITISIEFQLTTLLQYILKNLTHSFYEKRRITPKRDRALDKWDFTTDSFKGTYLGHTLHLVDAMLVELREKARADQLENARSRIIMALMQRSVNV